MEEASRRRHVEVGRRCPLWAMVLGGCVLSAKTALRWGRRSTRLLLIICSCISLLSGARAGVNLDLLEDGPRQPLDINGQPAISLEPADWWFDGGIVASPEFTVDGGVYDDFVDVFLYCGTLDAEILYTVGPSADETPDPIIDEFGRIGDFYVEGVPVRVVRNSVIKARGLHPMALDSGVSETDTIFIRITPPEISVQQADDQSNFNGSVQVLISAFSENPGAPPFIAYTINGMDPQPASPAGIGVATFTLHRTAVVKAIAWQDGMAPSLVRSSGVIEVDGELLFEAGWRGSVAWWELGEQSSYYGSYARARRRWGGACDELFETLVAPARVLDKEGGVGPAVLMGPACKGGLWDVDPRGVSTCSYQLLAFEGAVGYVGRQEEVRTGSPNCAVAAQPSLLSFHETLNGLGGLRFDSMLNRGLYAALDLEPLLAAGRLPTDSMSALLELSLSPAAVPRTRLHALLAAQQDGSGVSSRTPYAKGWSLLYSTSAERADVTFAFSASLAANLGPNNHGRFRTASFSVPSAAFASAAWHHLAAVYDGSQLALYWNGTLAAAVPACARPPCGPLVYPAAADALAKGATPLVVGGYENPQTGASVAHEGLLRGVRLFAAPLGPEDVQAAAHVLAQGAGGGGPCQPGEYGPYQGLQPCRPCPLGSFSASVAADRCDLCPVGRYADRNGSAFCAVCPPGLTTEGEGSRSADACEEPDECAAWSGLSNSCAEQATCSKTAGSFTCTCNAGFAGSGVECTPVCGDGHVVPGEQCDDANQRNADGCSAQCQIEPGWTCHDPPSTPPLDPPGPPAPPGSQCTCELHPLECCSRAYVACLHRSLRFDPRGIDDLGQDRRLAGSPQTVLAGRHESCSAACARQSPPHTCTPEPVPLALPDLELGGFACASTLDNASNAAVAPLLASPGPLPMLDEFAVDGSRALLSGGAGAQASPLLCYAAAPDGPWAANPANNSCDALPSIASGRRVCRCDPPPDVCSRACLDEHASCAALAQAPDALAAARSELLPCLDDPDYRRRVWAPDGTTYQDLSCPEVGRAGCEVTDANCSACPVSCGTCATCYQNGGRYYYGATETPHPAATFHPSALHGTAPWSVEQRATQAACKKGLAVCSQVGFEACVAQDFCFPIEAAAELFPVAPGEGVDELESPESPSCSCLSWYRMCVSSRLMQLS